MNTSPHSRRTRHRFTVDEFHRMAEVGIFDEDDRVELLEGEIVDMTPIGSQHVGRVNRLNELFGERISRDVVVSVQNPVRLDDHSEPEPDLALLQPREDRYASAIPRREDVLLIVEVSDSSLDEDRREKIPLYAQHDIPLVWLVDLQNDLLQIYESPGENGYRLVRTPDPDDVVTLEACPDFEMTPSELFI